MIRLRRSRRYQCVRALLQRLSDEKFEFARLVATQRKTRLIIALDQQFRPSEFT